MGVMMTAASRVMRSRCNFVAAISRRMFMTAGRPVNWRDDGPQNGEPSRQRPKCKMSNRAAHAAFSGKTN
jgi:hypothetical protein